MRLRLERRIAYLQNILNVRFPEGGDKVPYPIELVSTVQVSPLVEPPPVDILFNFMSSWTSSPCGNTNTPIPLPIQEVSLDILPIIELPLEIEQLDDGFTDIPEEELQQRDAEQKQLQDALTQLELDKLLKRKPRVKKI